MTFIETKIIIDDKILKNINSIAKRKNTTKNKVINDMLKKGLNNAESNIPEHLIANKNRKPDSERSRKLIGVIETDEPFDTKKALDELRRMEY
ncbi:hypothetical protein [Methanobrevibacter filiformis]|uniref:Ribbon-helix-helix protein CopG domain-containing protein n=1 Tax=Methanobrevibacter filiformis TaxID=55758 RepID=A0A166AJE5_9EURY|nr:hypothetical protein [Methanobrevibacter filiformis]KZX12106.1 hypothetical protein MBFIL_12360 [Methanobrevibacter filiformis]